MVAPRRTAEVTPERAAAPGSAPLVTQTEDPAWQFQLVRPYLIVLVLVALLGLVLRIRIYEHYQHSTAHAVTSHLEWIRLVLRVSFWLQWLPFVVIVLFRVLPDQWRHRPFRRQRLLLLGQLASGVTAVNLLSETLAIYRLDLGSYSLMIESCLLYVSLTLVFLFWYWYVDHPPRQPGSPWGSGVPGERRVTMPYGIVFPEEALERDLMQTETWKPQFVDYLYFAVLSSNCFGAPEGHSLVGKPIKRLHVLHSLAMISVFIVIMARAINTLK